METMNIEVEGNITLACLNPSEKLNIPSYTTDADHRHTFGVLQNVQDDIKLEVNENIKIGMEFNPKQILVFSNGHIGIGTPYISPELNIYKK